MKYQIIGAIVAKRMIGRNIHPSKDVPPRAIEIVSKTSTVKRIETAQASRLNKRTIRPYWSSAFSTLILIGVFDSHGNFRRSNIIGTIIIVMEGNNQIIPFDPQPSASPFALKCVGIVAGKLDHDCKTKNIP